MPTRSSTIFYLALREGSVLRDDLLWSFGHGGAEVSQQRRLQSYTCIALPSGSSCGKPRVPRVPIHQLGLCGWHRSERNGNEASAPLRRCTPVYEGPRQAMAHRCPRQVVVREKHGLRVAGGPRRVEQLNTVRCAYAYSSKTSTRCEYGRHGLLASSCIRCVERPPTDCSVGNTTSPLSVGTPVRCMQE
jgi:hypothetical protein